MYIFQIFEDHLILKQQLEPKDETQNLIVLHISLTTQVKVGVNVNYLLDLLFNGTIFFLHRPK